MLLPEFTSDAEQELRYYTTLLNAGDKDLHEIGELEAKASEDYLLKVEGQRGETGAAWSHHICGTQRHRD